MLLGVTPAVAADPSGSISGFVRAGLAPESGLVDIKVSLYDEAGDDVSPSEIITDAAGAFTIAGLDVGTYRIGFTGVGSNRHEFFDEFWLDSPTLAGAATIGVDAGQQVTGIIAKLDHTPRIKVLTLPTITGAIKIRNTVTANPGTWSPAPTSYDYFWYVRGELRGTGPTLALVDADYGKTIQLSVRANRDGYASLAESTKTGVYVEGGTMTGVVPVITGKRTVGSTLTAIPGVWKPADVVELNYQWYRSGVAISGATSPTLVLNYRDLGKTVTVRVVGRAPTGYDSVGKTSAGLVIVAGSLKPVVPVIVGDVVVGTKVTAEGTWGPGTVTQKYQWYANGVAISGATASTYTVGSAMLGKKLTVKVTGSKTGYNTTTRTSVASASVIRGTIVKGTVEIAGATVAGSKLTVVRADWITTGVAYAYRWYRDGVAISAATLSSYTTKTSDRGHVITVKVTATRNGFSTVTVASQNSITVDAVAV